MKELSTELTIRRERQVQYDMNHPADKHKLNEVQCDKTIFALFPNAGSKILTSYWLAIAQGQHCDVI